MKKVGIFTRMDIHNEKQIHFVPSDIINKLHNKVKLQLIPFTNEDTFESVKDYINECDGIILPGGDDIYPLELEVIKYLYKENIPTLGICLGMQEIAVACGGTMEKLNINIHKSKDKYVHEIFITKGSLLNSILKEDKILVNSRHTDYISSSNIDIVAKSNDNIIEAIEDKNKTFFIGVQWHPENLNDKYSLRLFEYFISVL